MKLLITFVLALFVPSWALAQTHPSAEMLKGFPVEVYEAAKVADKVASEADVAYTKALADMKKAEGEFRLSVEKEQDMEKFVLAHSRYMVVAMAVIKSSDGLGAANRTVWRLYFDLTEVTDDLPREIIFLDWLKAATAHEDSLRLGSRVDDALTKAGLAKMMAFIISF